MTDFLNIHTAQLLIGVGAMLWLYVKYSDKDESGEMCENSDDESDDGSVVSVTAGVVEKFKHL